MKVCINARTVFTPLRRGTGKNLIDLYCGISQSRINWEFVMLHRWKIKESPFQDCPNISDRRLPTWGDRFGLWNKLHLPLAIGSEKPDVFHAPANVGPPWVKTAMVATIHDLIPLQTDLLTPASAKWGEQVKATAQKARMVITPSEYSKKEIVAFCKISEEKVTVISWAPDKACQTGNMHFGGRKKYAELPVYCRHFDVGLIPFKVNELTPDPCGVREYLAAGLPCQLFQPRCLKSVSMNIWLKLLTHQTNLKRLPQCVLAQSRKILCKDTGNDQGNLAPKIAADCSALTGKEG